VVAATDTVDGRASFSSWGDYIDITAPGISIWTTTRGGSYGAVSGTSASSPIVAGVYALMMSANPALQPAALDNILFSTALDLGTAGQDQQFGHGRVRAANAVLAARSASATDLQPPTVTIAAPTGGQVSGLVPVDVTAADNIAVARVDLVANGSVVATDTISPYAFTLDSTRYADGQVSLQARAYDAAGNSASSGTVTVTVSNAASDTTPPAVTITNPVNGSTVSGTVSISVSATDDQKIAKIALSIDGQQVSVAYGSSLSYNWSVPKSKNQKKPARSTLAARAEDAAGNATTASVSVYRQ
jgi:hypothetical protein